MTNDNIALQALLEKTSDASMRRDMISFAAERLMASDYPPHRRPRHRKRSHDLLDRVVSCSGETRE